MTMTRSTVTTVSITITTVFLLLCIVHNNEAKKEKNERDCEVCIGTIEKFKKEISDELYGNTEKLEAAFRKFCKKFPNGGKENRFCYYVGGTEDAATGILSNLIKPLSYHLPANKICEKLKAMDAQICELRYDVKPDYTKLNKMKVGELKKILSNWGEDAACKGCAEKSDFIKKIRELMPKHEPEEWKKVEASGKEDL
uniref:Mesencephalic astrocyte-derived neurotrophic factor homolog n=1 Tax=Biomphalaria glabrata TaxID=6526 RepID=A0A2C9JKZ0_BIOGL